MKTFIIGGPSVPVYLTVDSTLITVDSTLYTVDQTILESYPYRLKVITTFSSQDFKIQLKNELTNEISDVIVDYFQYDGEYLCAFFDYDFKEGDSFELKVIDNPTNKMIFRDKAYATSQTDLENFQLSPKNNNNIIKY